MKKISLLLILLSLQAHSSTSSSCYGRDFRSQMGPVRDQGDKGWCYANAAADVLGFKTHLQLEQPLSAALMALLFNFEFSDSVLNEGGDVFQTLKLAIALPVASLDPMVKLNRGYCPKAIEERALASGKPGTLKTKLEALYKLKALYDEGRNNPSKRKDFADRIDQAQIEGSVLGKLDRSKVYNIFEKSNEKNFFLYFADLLCGSERKYNYDEKLTAVNRSEKETYTFRRSDGTGPVTTKEFTNDLFREIDETLNRDNIVAIGFDAEFLENDKISSGQNYDHAAVIIGRRWQNGSCQYLVRNSWGSGCKAPNFNSTDPNNRLKNRYSKFVAECDKGNLWIDEKNLKPNLRNINYLNNGPDPYVRKTMDGDPFRP